MITLQNVSKYYVMKSGKKNYILQDVSITIPKCNLAVLGPNGAGKSTLLRLIGGAEKPNSGTISCEGDVSWPLGLSAGFQGSLTGLENIKFVCKINGLSKKETLFVLNYVLEFSELGEHFDNPIKTYSSGMRARLAFALSTAFDFDVFLIDELTSVGDAAFKQKAVEEFEKIKARASIVYVSHGLQNLRKTCDKAILLKQGKLHFFDDIEEGIQTYLDYIFSINPAAAKKLMKTNGVKTASTKKTAAKVATTKKAAVKKTATKVDTTKKAAVKKTATKVDTTKKAAVKKTAAKVDTTKKTAVKKTSSDTEEVKPKPDTPTAVKTPATPVVESPEPTIRQELPPEANNSLDKI